jgi:hypothetical protein
LTNRLRVTNENVDASEAIKLIVNMPFTAVITTNYDKLLEQAFFKINGYISPVATREMSSSPILRRESPINF